VTAVQNGEAKEALASDSQAAVADEEVMWEFKWKNEEGHFIFFNFLRCKKRSLY
jgi:hypothetical protein